MDLLKLEPEFLFYLCSKTNVSYFVLFPACLLAPHIPKIGELTE